MGLGPVLMVAGGVEESAPLPGQERGEQQKQTEQTKVHAGIVPNRCNRIALQFVAGKAAQVVSVCIGRTAPTKKAA
jgi:hypothetical protein